MEGGGEDRGVGGGDLQRVGVEVVFDLIPMTDAVNETHIERFSV